MFQTYNNNYSNGIRTSKNNYKGEFCYIKEMNLNTPPEKVIELYFSQTYHNTFNEWFEEFFEITKLNEKSFNKEKGLDFYKLSNNNIIMLYTLEKLNKNKDEICKILNIPKLLHSNDSNKMTYKNLYTSVKNKIEYKQDYLDNLLNTKIMNFFYTKNDIKKMYSKYKIKLS